MSFGRTIERAVQTVTGQRTMFVRMRTNYCRPITVRNQMTGMEEETSKTIKVGEIVQVAADDPEFVELIERKYAFVVTKERNEKGKEIFVGEEPQGPPIAGEPISSKLDPHGMEAEQMGLLRKIANALDSVRVAPSKGAA